MKQEQLGVALGVASSASPTVSRIENGGTFGLDRVFEVAEALELDPADLVQLDDGLTRGQLALLLAAAMGGADVEDMLEHEGSSRDALLELARFEQRRRARRRQAASSSSTSAVA